MKTVYKETIGKATIELVQYGSSYIVRMDETGKHYERTFNPSPYPEKDPYTLAIAMYDATVQALFKKYNIAPTAIDKPDFTKVVNN